MIGEKAAGALRDSLYNKFYRFATIPFAVCKEAVSGWVASEHFSYPLFKSLIDDVSNSAIDQIVKAVLAKELDAVETRADLDVFLAHAVCRESIAGGSIRASVENWWIGGGVLAYIDVCVQEVLNGAQSTGLSIDVIGAILKEMIDEEMM